MQEQLKDKLVPCRHCGAEMCYEQHIQGLITWACLICGFQTNTQLMEGTDTVVQFERTLPELYKDIRFVDEAGLVWYPMHTEVPGIGIVFADGVNKEEWRWAFVPHIPVEAHEQERFKDAEGNYIKYKTNLHEVIHFDQHQFARALEAVGLI